VINNVLFQWLEVPLLCSSLAEWKLLQVNVNVLSQPVVNGTTGSAVTTPAAQWTMLSYQVMLILPLFLPDPHSAVIVLNTTGCLWEACIFEDSEVGEN
jgi:hypothetical protein